MPSPTPDEKQYHWSEGNKYALEAMKALLWLNGASAAALLAFFGGTRPRAITPAFGYSIVSFGVGATLSVILFICAYATQLHYGNNGITTTGQRIHNAAYLPLTDSLVAFLFGLWWAYSAIVVSVGA